MKTFLARHRFEALAVAIALVFSVLHLWTDDHPVSPGATQRSGLSQAFLRLVALMEGRVTDVQFRLRGPQAPHPDVVVVEVTEASAQRYGLWPWRRSMVAKAIDHLDAAGARAIGMDMFFTDEVKDTAAEAYSEVVKGLDATIQAAGGQNAVALAAFRAQLSNRVAVSPDAELARALSAAPQVVQGVAAYAPDVASSFAGRQAEYTALLAPHVITTLHKPSGPGQYEFSATIPSWPNQSAQTWLRVFAEQDNRFAHFNATPDPDGTLRRHPLFTRLAEPPGLLPSLSLQTAAAYFGARVEAVYDRDLDRLIAARLRGPDGAVVRTVPMQITEPYALINHLGHAKIFPRLDMADVVDGTFDPAKVAGKAVLMGVSLVGAYDQRVTPFSEMEPGVFTHASFLSNILADRFLTRPLSARWLEILFIFGVGLGLAFVLPRVKFVAKLVVVLALAVGYFVVDQALFTGPRIQVATVLPMVHLFASAFGVIFLGYVSTDREKAVLRSAFQHYLNASVMEQMLQHPERLKLGGEKKEMTVLFSDIRGFTTLSERMAPEALVKFINSYLTPMTRIVFEEGGTLDKYIGDALMAFWSAPLDQPDHALRACRAAVRMTEQLAQLKAAWREQNLPEFDIGVGINSGPMIVGNMGSDIRFDYTVMGDSVNLASRLEGTNKEYETRLLISEATYLLARDGIIARRLGAVRVKGKRKPVRIYELRGLGQAQGEEQETLALFEQAVDLFTEQKFDEAQARFTEVTTRWPDDPPSRKYLEEIAELRVHPPGPQWDGVYTATTK